MNLSAALDQYMNICLQALRDATHKVGAAHVPIGIRLKQLVTNILLLHMVLPRKINFTQMERYGIHTEKTYREAHRVEIDWVDINISLMQMVFNAGERLAHAIDPSYIKKAGRSTPWTDKFWSGCAGAAIWGLEILGMSVINIDMHECFALRAEQTPDNGSLALAKFTQMEWYIAMLKKHAKKLLAISKYVVADAAFSNKPFTDRLLKLKFHLVSRLRDDARLKYIYDGPHEKRRGPKRKYDGFIDRKSLDLAKMQEIHVEGVVGNLYTLIAYSVSLERNIRLVIWKMPKGSTKLFFSTDTEMSGVDVVEFYKTRFQIEFVFRDSKEFTGLCDSQARNLDKMDFAFNAALCSTNIAKVLRHQSGVDISMARLKSLMVNQYLTREIISKSARRPDFNLIQRINQALVDFEINAA